MTESTNQAKTGGWIAWIQRQSLPVRVLILSISATAVIALLFLGTALLYFQNIRSIPRTIPAAIPDAGVTVAEFAQLDAPDAYPATVAVAPDGTIYTASYMTGTVWRIASDGTAQPIADSEAQIGSVIALEVDSTGNVYVLDRVDPLQPSGAIIWRIMDDTIEQVVTIPAQGRRFISLPAALAADASGYLYVADLQYDSGLATGRILRITLDSGEIDEWWQMPDAGSDKPSAPAGLAYDASSNSLIVTDAAREAIYRIALANDAPTAETLYEFTGTQDRPGLNGVTVAHDGTIYVAALGLNRVARLENSELVYLAAGFRGGSDVAYDGTQNRLFVNNWDQRWILPVRFVFISQQFEPRLPFSIEVIQLGTSE
jgi:sugar lactone lactonase YvrE